MLPAFKESLSPEEAVGFLGKKAAVTELAEVACTLEGELQQLSTAIRTA